MGENVPRYFFNAYDGSALIDNEGTEFADLKSAKIEAVLRASHLLKDNAKNIADGEDWHLEAVNVSGLILFRIDILVTDAPVSRPDPLMNR